MSTPESRAFKEQRANTIAAQTEAYRTGGPAFPRAYSTEDPVLPGYLAQEGLSIRDWFAGMAITAATRIAMCDSYDEDVIAEIAYDIAAAMIDRKDEIDKEQA